MKYRYEFEKGSKKHICPNCGKKTFVRYVDNKTMEYLPKEYGRCDRENKCKYWATPNGEFTNTYEVCYTPPPPISYHPIELVKRSGRNFKKNNFISFLKTIFNKEEVKLAITKYLIGTSKKWNGATVFWQIDDLEKVRHGKIMLYDELTGKRSKNTKGNAYINSVRSTLKIKEFNLKQCLFGLHLIKETDTKTIAITEGEKTAIIMSLFKPEYVWMATGSKHGFKYEMLKNIKDYKIIAFPDKGEYNDWLDKAIELNNFGFDIEVSSLLEKLEYSEGSDLADVFIDEVKSDFKPVIEDKLQNDKILTKTENIALKLSKINPSLKKLISVFDLTDNNGIPITNY